MKKVLGVLGVVLMAVVIRVCLMAGLMELCETDREPETKAVLTYSHDNRTPEEKFVTFKQNVDGIEVYDVEAHLREDGEGYDFYYNTPGCDYRLPEYVAKFYLNSQC